MLVLQSSRAGYLVIRVLRRCDIASPLSTCVHIETFWWLAGRQTASILGSACMVAPAPCGIWSARQAMWVADLWRPLFSAFSALDAILCFKYKWVEFRQYCVLYCLGSVEARDLCNCREVRGEKNGQGNLSTPHSEGRGVYGRWTRGPLCPFLSSSTSLPIPTLPSPCLWECQKVHFQSIHGCFCLMHKLIRFRQNIKQDHMRWI